MCTSDGIEGRTWGIRAKASRLPPLPQGTLAACPPDQVPGVAVQVLEHRDAAVAFVARLLAEAHPARQQRGVRGGEVVGFEEQADAAAGEAADLRGLRFVRRAREQQRGARVLRRRHAHPALAGFARRVLEQHEAEHVGEPRDGLVVVADEIGDGAEGLHASQ